MTHFNDVANSWDTEEKFLQNKMYADKIKYLLNKNNFQNVLEVGCGTGLLGANFIEDKNHFLGIDTSVGMLKVFEQKFKNLPKVKYLNLNLEESELDDSENKFDLIISSMAFHHLQSPEQILIKLKKLLAPRGAVAIIDLDEENGTFHPDPKNMGVQHFGFSKITTEEWSTKANFKKFERSIINTIKKESGEFPVFLAVFFI